MRSSDGRREGENIKLGNLSRVSIPLRSETHLCSSEYRYYNQCLSTLSSASPVLHSTRQPAIFPSCALKCAPSERQKQSLTHTDTHNTNWVSQVFSHLSSPSVLILLTLKSFGLLLVASWVPPTLILPSSSSVVPSPLAPISPLWSAVCVTYDVPIRHAADELQHERQSDWRTCLEGPTGTRLTFQTGLALLLFNNWC